MKTAFETKINTTPGAEKGINTVEQTRNSLNNSLLSAIEKGEIVNRKGNERLSIQRQTLDEIQPLTNSTHFMVERQLAEMFGLKGEKVSELKDDFREPITLSSVLTQAEELWNSSYA